MRHSPTPRQAAELLASFRSVDLACWRFSPDALRKGLVCQRGRDVDVGDIAAQVAHLELSETYLVPRRQLSEMEWESTDELERELRSVLGDSQWHFRWTEDGLWVTRR